MLLLALAFSAPSAADECPDMRESDSPVCSEILEKKLFENTVSFTENGKKYTYVKEPYTYVFTDARVDSEPTNPEIMKFGKASKQGVAIDAFPNCFYATPELFEHNGDLYAVYPDRNLNLVYPGTNEIAVFKFDDEKFKGICRFTRVFSKTTLERGKTPDLCKKILDKKYTKTVSEPLRNLMTDDEMQKIVFSQIHSDGVRFQILHHGYQGTRVDYNNDGKTELLIDTTYDMECYNFFCGEYASFADGGEKRAFRAYIPETHTTVDISSGALPDQLPFRDGYDLFDGEYQEIVAVDGKNYLLTSNRDHPRRLDEITTLPDGTNKTERLCSFQGQYEWR